MSNAAFKLISVSNHQPMEYMVHTIVESMYRKSLFRWCRDDRLINWPSPPHHQNNDFLWRLDVCALTITPWPLIHSLIEKVRKLNCFCISFQYIGIYQTYWGTILRKIRRNGELWWWKNDAHKIHLIGISNDVNIIIYIVLIHELISP